MWHHIIADWAKATLTGTYASRDGIHRAMSGSDSLTLLVCARPMKKKGTSAGIPRGHGERPSPVGNGVPNNQVSNNSADLCALCHLSFLGYTIVHSVPFPFFLFAD